MLLIFKFFPCITPAIKYVPASIRSGIVLIWAFGRIMHGTTSESKKAVNNAASPAPAIPTAPFVSNDDIEGETIAAISAAVMMMYEGTGKIPVIRSIKRADRGFVNAWRAAGIANNTRSF